MKNQPKQPKHLFPVMALGQVPAAIAQWLKAEPSAPLRLIFGDGYVYPWPSLEPISTAAGVAETVSDLVAERPICDGLEIHYQGRDLLFLSLHNAEKGVARHIAARLPPGRSLQDYQTAFFGKGVGLISRAVLEPFFQVAAQRNLFWCRVFAFSGEYGQAATVRLRCCRWLVEAEGGEIRGMVPFPPEGSHLPPRFRDLPGERDERSALFTKPMFTWIDPMEKERRSRRLNRGILAAASLLILLVLGVLGGCLWFGKRYYEDRLGALSLAGRAFKAERSQYLDQLEQLNETLARIQACRQAPREMPLHAVRIRQILNYCPTGMRLERLEYRRGLEGDQYILMEGLALDPGQASQFLGALEELFPGWNAFMEALHELDEKERSPRGEQPGPLRYRFKIKLEAVA